MHARGCQVRFVQTDWDCIVFMFKARAQPKKEAETVTVAVTMAVSRAHNLLPQPGTSTCLQPGQMAVEAHTLDFN